MTAIVVPAYEQVISNQHFNFFTKYYRIASLLVRHMNIHTPSLFLDTAITNLHKE